MRKILMLLMLPVYFCGCVREERIGFDFPFEGEKLGVFGFISNEARPQLKLVLSQPVLTDTFGLSAYGAEAFLLENGEVVGDFTFQDELGTAEVNTDPEKEYSVRVLYEGEAIESEPVQLPSLVKIEDVNYEMSPDSTNIIITYSFQDDGSQNDYYGYSISQKKDDRLVKYSALYNTVSNDVEFNGEKKTIIEEKRINVYIIDPVNGGGELVKSNTAVIKLYHLSESVYLFNKSLEENGQFGNQYSNQAPLWSNINGAYGYMGAVMVDSVVINY